MSENPFNADSEGNEIIKNVAIWENLEIPCCSKHFEHALTVKRSQWPIALELWIKRSQASGNQIIIVGSVDCTYNINNSTFDPAVISVLNIAAEVKREEKSMETSQKRVLFLYEFKPGHNASEATKKICKAFREDTVDEWIIQWLFEKCRAGNMILQSELSGQPGPSSDNDELRLLVVSNARESVRGVRFSRIVWHLQ